METIEVLLRYKIQVKMQVIMNTILVMRTNVSVTESGNGAGSTSANITHTYTSAGSYTMTVQSSGTPDITAQTDTDTINFTAEDPPAAPSGLSSQTLSLNTAYQGNSPKLAHGFEDNTGSESSPSAGDALTSSSKRRYATTTSISTQTVNNVYSDDTGTLTANCDSRRRC